MSVDTKTGDVVPKEDLVTLTIDGRPVSVPKGTLIIRAAETVGTVIPRFCDHPLLDPAGACRECLVDIPDAGNGRGFPKPQPACTMPVAEGMVVNTADSSPVARKAQEGMLEFLLINHPLDCPICDKGGECPLQNQSMSHGRGESRYGGVKRTYPKPINISAQILLDRERCILCQRCTRFSDQIAGDPFINLQERGAVSQIGAYAQHPYDSYFSGNVIQICPVGALTSEAYRFRSRPFDLVSTKTTCENCAAGCELRTDHRHYKVMRRQAGDLPEVNEEWSCDRGRFGFVSGRGDDRVTTPLVRQDGVLRPASWAEAIDAAVTGLKAAGRVGVLTGGRLTVETNLAWSRFARTVLGTNDIDFRARVASAEEESFLASQVAGRQLAESVQYADLERAGKVVLVDLEPEDECPIIFLRLRKAWRKKHLPVHVLGTHLSRGSVKMGATLVPTLPGEEPASLERLGADGLVDAETIILVGERAAAVPGTLGAVVDLCREHGARLAWVPRRAGEVGAVEAGCLPSLLPGGRPVADAAARVDLAAAWGVDQLPATEGLDTAGMLAGAADGTLGALLVSGVQPADLPDPDAARAALEGVGFLVSLEQRLSEVAQRADVVLPVSLLEETSGTFLNWEHRPGRVRVVNRQPATPMNEIRVLAALADAMGTPLGFRTVVEAHEAWQEIGPWTGQRVDVVTAPARSDDDAASAQVGGLVLDTWRELLDDSACLDGEEALRATARPLVARIGQRTADELGAVTGDLVVLGDAGRSVELPVEVEPTMVDGAVWVPAHPGTPLVQTTGLALGDVVRVSVDKTPKSDLSEGGVA
ncbi:NADH-quinone oxidoreductase subunit G [Acidipropionibacterium timonense]|uniref:NADH-quinone oxidoreductase subunit G n=1 Tax=Acidipropionibacterium timonense TaxID=2161818 RepID=UPI0010301CDA|nr:NADH-quinone oxidoreductase subunit G [Acidipropionibacterium timonense]